MSNFYFKVLSEGYIHSGNYAVKQEYKPGVHHVQGLGQVAGAITPVAYPDNFGAEYNTFVKIEDPTTADPEKLYDRAAYNTFESPYISEVQVPAVKLVTLLYMYDTNGVRVSRSLVEFDGSIATLTAKYPDLVAGYMYSEAEYYETFVDKGFNRFGKVYPRGMSKTAVDEMRLISGYVVPAKQEIDPATGAPIAPNSNATKVINLYVSPLWVQEGAPAFTEVYLHGEASKLVTPDYDAAKANLAPRMARWFAFSNEGKRDFINFTDHSGGVDFAARFGSNPYGITRTDINPSEPETGDEVKNAYPYNVTNTIKN